MADDNEELRKFLYEKANTGHFVFVPTSITAIPYANGLFIPMVQQVFLTEDDFYPVQNKFGLNHFGLMKFASAADIQWVGEGSGRTDGRNDPDYCNVMVIGELRTPSGIHTRSFASKHLDIKSKQLAIETKHANDFDYKVKWKGTKGHTGKGWEVKEPWPDNKNEYVKKLTERDVGQLRDNMDERCESGAQNRVIKKLLRIPGSLPAKKVGYKNVPAWLDMEFHIVNYQLNPLNPIIQQAQVACYQRAMGDIYGTPIAIGAPQPAIVAPVPPIDVTPKTNNVTKNHEIITKSTDNFTRKPEDSSLVDFENQETKDKVHTITQLIKQTKYPNYDKDISASGCPLEDWTDKQLIDYFQHINKGASKR